MTTSRYFEYPDNSPRAQVWWVMDRQWNTNVFTTLINNFFPIQDRQRGIFPSIISPERRKLLQQPKDNGDSEIGTASRQDNRRRKLLCRREVTHAQEHMILPLYYTDVDKNPPSKNLFNQVWTGIHIKINKLPTYNISTFILI